MGWAQAHGKERCLAPHADKAAVMAGKPGGHNVLGRVAQVVRSRVAGTYEGATRVPMSEGAHQTKNKKHQDRSREKLWKKAKALYFRTFNGTLPSFLDKGSWIFVLY